jgi:GntR family transcriptional repressor for pyruvate dehydrogenase complex
MVVARKKKMRGAPTELSMSAVPQPPRRRVRLAEAVVEALRMRIESGAMRAGEQLPTEPQLEREFGVSRTVVREAIVALRAAGLVEPIQGKGVFVREAERPLAQLSSPEIDNIPITLEMLEFRIAIEGEGAAIAAQRRSPQQEGEVRRAHEQMALDIEAGRPTVESDFAFHEAVALCTNNSFFIEEIRRFGPGIIPRSQFPTLAQDKEYLTGVHTEHARILEAIAEQDSPAARQAMREHLLASQKRYRRFIA